MSQKNRFQNKRFFTMVTLIGFFPGVCPQMLCKTTTLYETLARKPALIWLLASVSPHMSSKTAIL